jgi:uncharacterized protein YecE (DUF72 family)
MEWHIGCSGFHYKHWKGIFYPENLPPKKWFSFYAQHFNTLELNVTFYRFPRLSMLLNWHKQAPEGFQFSVKAPQAITHFRQFHNTLDMMSDFYGVVRAGLQEKLGPILFQLPPRLRYERERLQRILDQMDPAFDNVLEFRHSSWWQPEVYEQLGAKHVSFCGMSHPELPSEVIINSPVVYYRFHGVPDLYRSSYGRDDLQEIIERVSDNDQIEQIWFYFNNDAAVAAIPNAELMTQLALHGTSGLK